MYIYPAPNTPTSIVHTGGENINVAWHPDGSVLAIGTKAGLYHFDIYYIAD